MLFMTKMMPEISAKHNLFRESLLIFEEKDPHLYALSRLKYQHSSTWWANLSLDTPGIYILTGGRQTRSM